MYRILETGKILAVKAYLQGEGTTHSQAAQLGVAEPAFREWVTKYKTVGESGLRASTKRMQKHNNNQLVFETFDLAIQKYPDAHPPFHSDRGFQYTSKQFKAKLDKQGMKQSMSRVGRCIDNGPMEGFWGILKCGMYYLHHFQTYEELVEAIEKRIYYYSHQRRQHKLNRLPPATYRSLLEAA